MPIDFLMFLCHFLAYHSVLLSLPALCGASKPFLYHPLQHNISRRLTLEVPDNVPKFRQDVFPTEYHTSKLCLSSPLMVLLSIPPACLPPRPQVPRCLSLAYTHAPRRVTPFVKGSCFPVVSFKYMFGPLCSY